MFKWESVINSVLNADVKSMRLRLRIGHRALYFFFFFGINDLSNSTFRSDRSSNQTKEVEKCMNNEEIRTPSYRLFF